MAGRPSPSSVRPSPDETPDTGEQPTREALLDAAEECFARYGVSKTSMNDVARQAGLSRPTLYRYFADREALNVGVVLRRSTRLARRAAKVVASQPTLSDQLVEGLVFLVDHGRRDEVVMELVVSDSPRSTAGLAASDTALRVSATVWESVLRNPELRPDLRREQSEADMLLWLVQVQLSLIRQLGAHDDPQAWARIRRFVRGFVVPAFVVDSSP